MHTAFTFLHEGGVTKGVMDPNNVAPGTLVALIQKGMQYLELEANLDAGVVRATVW
jgi:transducin (beta)-like 1